MLTSLLYRLRRRQRVHLLHIGKTGGTALKAALAGHLSCRDYVVVPHEHHMKLRDIPAQDLFMFVVRDPLTRFVSGFHGRRRQGRPRYFYPWSDEERVAFERFHTPNDLARALLAADESVRTAAENAMRSIRHVRSCYWDWFESADYLRSRVAGLFFIGHVETLDDDFEHLRAKLGLPPDVALPRDPVAAHRTPGGFDRHLDADAVQALTRWYARDFEFIKLCRELDGAPDRHGTS